MLVAVRVETAHRNFGQCERKFKDHEVVVGQAVVQRSVMTKKALHPRGFAQQRGGPIDQMAAFGKHHAALVPGQVLPLLGKDRFFNRGAEAVHLAEPALARGRQHGFHRGMVTPLIAHLHDEAFALGVGE